MTNSISRWKFSQIRTKQIRAVAGQKIIHFEITSVFSWNTEAGIVSEHRRPRANWSQVKGSDLLAVGEKM